MVAFIQADREGHPANRNCYAAWEGFRERGLETRFFYLGGASTPEDLETRMRELLPAEEVIVHGTIPNVHAALRARGIVPPEPLDYPESLREFLGRRIWETTLGEARDSANWPLFIKPLNQGKAFPGIVVRAFRNLFSTMTLEEDFPILASEVLPFSSEWRVFVLNGDVLDIRPYGSNPFRTTPSRTRIEAMIAAYVDAPAGFALDVGVGEKDGETYLVEVNDSYSLGTYGLDPMLYAMLIQARWQQLTQRPS